MIENELSFLVKKLPKDLKKYPKKLIRQGYFSDSLEALRIRDEGGKYFLTKKLIIKKGDFSRYNEITLPIEKEEFERLWPVCKKTLVKTRYYYPLNNGLKAEIDIYHGKLKGLITVEVEFPNEKARKRFKPPDWFGLDITQKFWSANPVLAGLTYKKVKKLIEREGKSKK
jgi:CYTH domain-containing protein